MAITVTSICPIRRKKTNDPHVRRRTHNMISISKQIWRHWTRMHPRRKSLDMHEFASSPTRRDTPVNNSRVPLSFGKVAKVRTHRESLYSQGFNTVNVAKCRWVITKGKWPIRYDGFHLEGDTSSRWLVSLVAFYRSEKLQSTIWRKLWIITDISLHSMAISKWVTYFINCHSFMWNE